MVSPPPIASIRVYSLLLLLFYCINDIYIFAPPYGTIPAVYVYFLRVIQGVLCMCLQAYNECCYSLI